MEASGTEEETNDGEGNSWKETRYCERGRRTRDADEVSSAQPKAPRRSESRPRGMKARETDRLRADGGEGECALESGGMQDNVEHGRDELENVDSRDDPDTCPNGTSCSGVGAPVPARSEPSHNPYDCAACLRAELQLMKKRDRLLLKEQESARFEKAVVHEICVSAK